MVMIVGIRGVDYINKSGNQIKGVSLSVNYPYPKEQGIGYRCAEHFVSGAVPSQFKLGEAITLTFEPGFNGTQKCTGAVYAK